MFQLKLGRIRAETCRRTLVDINFIEATPEKNNSHPFAPLAGKSYIINQLLWSQYNKLF
jgi:hypothetical protein